MFWASLKILELLLKMAVLSDWEASLMPKIDRYSHKVYAKTLNISFKETCQAVFFGVVSISCNIFNNPQLIPSVLICVIIRCKVFAVSHSSAICSSNVLFSIFLQSKISSEHAREFNEHFKVLTIDWTGLCFLWKLRAPFLVGFNLSFMISCDMLA